MPGFVWKSADFLLESEADVLQDLGAMIDICIFPVLLLWQCYSAAVKDQLQFSWGLHEPRTR